MIDQKVLQPKGDMWQALRSYIHDGTLVHRWINGTIVACVSRHAAVESKTSKLLRTQFHLSISNGGGRASDDVVRGVLADFNMEGAEEDNHLSGIARHFWLDEGRAVQPECECKLSEETIVEPDGYRWQTSEAK